MAHGVHRPSAESRAEFWDWHERRIEAARGIDRHDNARFVDREEDVTRAAIMMGVGIDADVMPLPFGDQTGS